MTLNNADRSAQIARSKAERTADINLPTSTDLSAQCDPLSISPLDLPETQFQEALLRRQRNRHQLLQWISSSLKDGVDYGSIPTKRGPSKPSLLKPGAIKIINMMGLAAHFAVSNHRDPDHIIVECLLQDAQSRVLAHGLGGRTLKQDGGDLNKALKMASKSSMIDAVLKLAGLSEIFTQDLEDMVAPKVVTPETDSGDLLISTLQVQRLHQKIRTLNLSLLRVNQWLTKAWSVDSIEHLPRERFDTLMGKLDQWAEDLKAQQQRRA
ncbi:hypothetical protein U5801_00930 [Lamprobacter modestohalophilus]|uniref:hypothetical protein n=1 Tax=Lamprobacter modestohalophilus TaxID=1064514 RepID=UPI002ADEAD5E|nr:hypothetical protein [Lamprobacter modestohalophilus]MEA1048387.1 hypothetical protein [Lamprobacter modestohalophilus]